jgi:hypothetical protein
MTTSNARSRPHTHPGRRAGPPLRSGVGWGRVIVMVWAESDWSFPFGLGWQNEQYGQKLPLSRDIEQISEWRSWIGRRKISPPLYSKFEIIHTDRRQQPNCVKHSRVPAGLAWFCRFLQCFGSALRQFEPLSLTFMLPYSSTANLKTKGPL